MLVIGSDMGYPDQLGFEFDGELMVLPVLDTYEQLASGFLCLLILFMCGDPRSLSRLMMMRLHDDGRFMSFLGRLKRIMSVCGPSSRSSRSMPWMACRQVCRQRYGSTGLPVSDATGLCQWRIWICGRSQAPSGLRSDVSLYAVFL